MLRLLLLTVSGLAALQASPVFAQTGGPIPDVPEALEGLVDRGAQIRYLGKQHGLDGWIAIYQGQEQYYYVTADKKAFVTGLMFGADGRPITVEQVRDLQAQGGAVLDLLAEADEAPTVQQNTLSKIGDVMKTESPAERMFSDIQNSNWIRLGNENAPVIYAFVDPQCPHCHEMMKQMRGEIDAGRVQVRIVPVGFVQGSLAQAAFLIAAPNGADLFFRHLDGDQNALPAKSEISTQAVQKNMALMQAWKFNVTPLNVYRAKDGTVKIVRGVPKDIPALLGELQPAALN